MLSITDIYKLIPDSLKQSAVDALVETVVARGEGLLNESILNKIKGLRSDAAFRLQFNNGLQRGLQRFIDEYQLQDEDLVAAIAADKNLFTQPEIQPALQAILQQPGHYLVEERESLNQSFASVLPQRLNRERVDQAITFLLKCLAQELWHLPELQPIYSLEFQRITAESTHEQLSVQKAQLAALDSLNIGVREALLQLTDALSEQKQLTIGTANTALSAPHPAIYHNLPQPDYGEFVGRNEEIQRVFKLLRPLPYSRHSLIVIDGIGGIGKSTLALEVAHRCLQAGLHATRAEQPEQAYLTQLRQTLINRFSEDELQTLCFDMALDYEILPGQGKEGKTREFIAYLNRRNRLPELIENLRRLRPDIREVDLFDEGAQLSDAEQFDAIIWISAKRTTLTGEGISERHQHISTLADIYRTIAITLEREDLIRARPKEQPELVSRVLRRQRTLLILDNLETIDDPAVNSFLQDLPLPTKAVITSRHRISLAVPIRLVGMPWSDAQRLIKRESTQKDVTLSTPEAKRLYRRTGGVPLAIVWSIAQMGFGYGIENVLRRLGSATSDVARFCFEGSVEPLRGQPAHQLLMACAIFTNDVSRTGLEWATQLPILDQDDGLAQLETLSLLNHKRDRFSLMPLTRTFALAELERYPEDDKQIRRRWLNYLAKLCQEPIGEYYWRYRDHTFYEEGELIREALEWAYDYGSMDVVFVLSRSAYDYFEVIGDWNSILTYVGRALTLAESVSDRFTDRARFANVLGWINYQQGNYDKAKHWYDLAFDNYSLAKNRGGIAITWQHLSSLSRKLKDFNKAKSQNDRAWQIAKELNDGDLQALIETNHGKLARDMGDWNVAWEHFDNVRKYFEERVSESPRDEPLARSTWGHLAIVAINLGQPELAQEYCLRSLEYFEKRGTKGFLATLKYRLALAEQALGEVANAHQHLQEAIEWFERLGMKPDLKEAQLTRNQLEEQM